jgi:hypothetical protein
MRTRDSSYRETHGKHIGPILHDSVMKVTRTGRHGTAAQKAAEQKRHAQLKAALAAIKHLLP